MSRQICQILPGPVFLFLNAVDYQLNWHKNVLTQIKRIFMYWFQVNTESYERRLVPYYCSIWASNTDCIRATELAENGSGDASTTEISLKRMECAKRVCLFRRKDTSRSTGGITTPESIRYNSTSIIISRKIENLKSLRTWSSREVTILNMI